MIGVTVTFEYDGDFDRERIVGVAEHARSAFEGMPDLRLKVFTVDAERRRALNLYVWDTEDAARRFFDDELTERVTGLHGVRPRIEFCDVAALVDNVRATSSVVR